MLNNKIFFKASLINRGTIGEYLNMDSIFHYIMDLLFFFGVVKVVGLCVSVRLSVYVYFMDWLVSLPNMLKP